MTPAGAEAQTRHGPNGVRQIMTTYPDQLSDDGEQQLQAAAEAVRELTIEDREYALSESELPAEKRVLRDGGNLPYVVRGSKPLADEIVVKLDGDDARIGVVWNSRRSHYQDADYAGRVYDAMAEAGLEPPTVDRLGPTLGRTVGVQFMTDGIIIENILQGVRD